MRHILHAIDKIEEFLDGKSNDDMRYDTLLYYGVVKNIEIVGEAAYMLTEDFRNSHPDTPWRQIIGMRHYIVHGYYSIDSNEVWHVAKRDLPILKAQVINYLKELS